MLKRPDFSPAQPWRAETGLTPSNAAASEGPRRYKPHFVWAVRPCNGSWRTEKPLQRFRYPRGSLRDVEGLNDARTNLADFFSILLEGNPHGLTSTVMIAGRLSAPFTISGPAMSITVSVNWNDFGSDTGGATNVALASFTLLRVTR
jgi:hypothetical protein